MIKNNLIVYKTRFEYYLHFFLFAFIMMSGLVIFFRSFNICERERRQLPFTMHGNGSEFAKYTSQRFYLLILFVVY